MLVFRRSAAALGALAAVSLVAAAGQPAVAAAPGGTASAVTARVGLDVTLLNSVDVPIDVSLNAIQAPASADGNILTALVGGMQGGRSTLVDAKVGHSSAVVDRNGARATADLVTANVRVPGLLLHDLVTVHQISAKADCPVGGTPTASVNVLGDVSVLGTKVSLAVGGPTKVTVPGIGVVDVEFSQRTVTDRTAAATALLVDVTVNPGQLNVLKVSGRVELASVRCALGSGSGSGTPPTTPATPTGTPGGTPTATSPGHPTTGSTATSGPAVPVSVTTRTSGNPTAAPALTDLAETGGGSATPLIGGVALVLLGAGGGTVALTRRRRRSH